MGYVIAKRTDGILPIHAGERYEIINVNNGYITIAVNGAEVIISKNDPDYKIVLKERSK